MADTQETVTGADDQVDTTVDAAATDDTTGADGPGTEEQGDLGDQGGAPDDEEDQLLSREELEALKDNPEALRRALQRSYTQKTQALAAGNRLLEQLNADPEGTIAQLAQLRGLEIVRREPAKGTGIRDKAVAALGEEVANAFLPVIEELAQEMVEQQLGPIRQDLDTLKTDASFQASVATTKAFASQYKDYKNYEKSMIALSKKLLPARGMSDYEYMEHLYTVAKSRAGKATATKDAIDRMQASAGKAETRPTGVPGSKVAASFAGRTPTFQEAWDAAKKGIRFED